MPFSVNCTDRPCVYKINSSIQANKIFHLHFVYPWKETDHVLCSFTTGHLKGSPWIPLIHADFPRAREQGPFDPAPAVSPSLGYFLCKFLPDCESCNM